MPRIEQTLLLKFTNQGLVKEWLKGFFYKYQLQENMCKVLKVESLGAQELPSTVLEKPSDKGVYRYRDLTDSSKILTEKVPETKYLSTNFGEYRRHQHGTVINIDMIVKTEFMDVLQHNFWTNPQVLRASFDRVGMLETDLNKAPSCGGINWTNFEDLSDVTLKKHGYDLGVESEGLTQRSPADQARRNRTKRLEENLKKFIKNS